MGQNPRQSIGAGFRDGDPGHGPLTNKAGLLAYRNMVEKLYLRAAELIRAGKSRQEVGKAMIAEFHWDPAGPQMTLSLPGMMTEAEVEAAPSQYAWAGIACTLVAASLLLQ